jgi:hypothetical protein
MVIDNISQELSNLVDSFGNDSLGYIEEKVEKAHYLLFKNEKKVKIK